MRQMPIINHGQFATILVHNVVLNKIHLAMIILNLLGDRFFHRVELIGAHNALKGAVHMVHKIGLIIEAKHLPQIAIGG